MPGVSDADDLRAISGLEAQGNLVLNFALGQSLTLRDVGTTQAILDDVIFV